MKSTRRTAQATVAALALAGLLVGCAGSNQAAEPNGKVTGDITVLTTDGFAKDALAPAFEKKYPGTKVKVQVVGDIGTIQQQVRTQLSSGTASDVFSVFPGSGNPTAVQTLAGSGKFMYDLSDRDWAKKYPDALKSVASAKGSVYAGLYTVNNIGAIYNTTALKAAGLTAPTNWNDVLAFCAAAKSAGKVAYALGAQDQWVTQMVNYALTATLVYGPDPKFSAEQTEKKTTFADSKWATSFEKQQQMIDAGCFQKDLLGTGYDATTAMVAAGDALGVVQGNWMVNVLEKKNPDATFTLNAFPATDNADDTVMPVAAGAGFAVNSRTKNLATALAFVDFSMSPEGLKLATDATGGQPPYPVDTIKTPDSLAEVAKFLSANRTSSFPDQGWPNSKVQAAHLAGLQDLFSGSATAKDVMDRMQAAFDEGSE